MHCLDVFGPAIIRFIFEGFLSVRYQTILYSPPVVSIKYCNNVMLQTSTNFSVAFQGDQQLFWVIVCRLRTNIQCYMRRTYTHIETFTRHKLQHCFVSCPSLWLTQRSLCRRHRVITRRPYVPAARSSGTEGRGGGDSRTRPFSSAPLSLVLLKWPLTPAVTAAGRVYRHGPRELHHPLGGTSPDQQPPVQYCRTASLRRHQRADMPSESALSPQRLWGTWSTTRAVLRPLSD